MLKTYDLKHFKLNEELIQDVVNAVFGAKIQTAGKVLEMETKVIGKK